MPMGERGLHPPGSSREARGTCEGLFHPRLVIPGCFWPQNGRNGTTFPVSGSAEPSHFQGLRSGEIQVEIPSTGNIGLVNQSKGQGGCAPKEEMIALARI